MTPTLRFATPADAEAIARIWHAGWQDAHLGNVPDELITARTPDSFVERAVDRAANADAEAKTVVADVDGAVAGFIMVLDDEVEQVYVDASFRGGAVAPALLAEAERLVAAGGHDTAWLAVVAGNTRARRYYERHGWADHGPFDHLAPGDIVVPAHRYVKAVR
ncbi:GNAT family N-acetyltransferase [Labedaea rhizosphaerae]|uniref:Acetyltransferase (GNAT) family protein n=1 Tax=Labedaea rhizosphaerae TaxID=598644 RepID=A0A4R6S8M0_LABRH|nr:GNAT family N-acetyltransferase [Labedaea rhizosphaerae]TDP95195.1 acetyltransferase (GNAT) family protein [Labedaea rhizosphaerae]